MSELTPCNYCTLRRIKARAEKKGNRVILAPAKDASRGGTDVLVHPKHIPAKDARAKRKKYFVAWMMEIPDSCCC